MSALHVVVLVIDTAAMIAGLLAGPEVALAAFLAISIGLGAHIVGTGRVATKTEP